MDRIALQATVPGVTKSQTRLRLHFHFHWVSVLPSSLWEPLSQVVHSFPISPAAPPVLPSVPAALTSARGHHARLPAALLQEPPLPFSGGSSEAQRGNDCPGSARSSSPTPQSSPYFPVPGESWVGRAPLTRLHQLPTRDSASESCGPGRNTEVLGVCDSATPAVLHHPIYSPASVHTRPRSGHRTCIPTDPHPCRSKGAPLGQGRTSALFSPLTVPRPHLRVLIHGSVRDNTAMCICFLNFASPGDWG